jgi:hypothetical protein
MVVDTTATGKCLTAAALWTTVCWGRSRVDCAPLAVPCFPRVGSFGSRPNPSSSDDSLTTTHAKLSERARYPYAHDRLMYGNQRPVMNRGEPAHSHCGSEGRAFESRRSPPDLQVKRRHHYPGEARVLQPYRNPIATSAKRRRGLEKAYPSIAFSTTSCGRCWHRITMTRPTINCRTCSGVGSARRAPRSPRLLLERSAR